MLSNVVRQFHVIVFLIIRSFYLNSFGVKRRILIIIPYLLLFLLLCIVFYFIRICIFILLLFNIVILFSLVLGPRSSSSFKSNMHHHTAASKPKSRLELSSRRHLHAPGHCPLLLNEARVRTTCSCERHTLPLSTWTHNRA